MGAFCVDSCLALGMLLWASYQDIRDFTIPMLSILCGFIGGFLSGLLLSGLHGLIESSVGAAIGLGLGLLMFQMVRLGIGDVLLFSALGSILGPTSMLCVFVVSNTAALIRLIIPVLRRHRYSMPKPFRRWIHPFLKRNRVKRIAFAPYILLGTLVITCALAAKK
ncbi:prepilin peptidase [Alicyclobacillus acidoterrestris]|uniref:prepilin peptidase n=2 Tax=Alicyclobacillus acidoterrestris TaxID=1450 RepID=UPI0003861ADE|nr:hypothetical protein N007_04855 [Alicyclobacillus acidoterrestris ATCC 49025]GEO27754.1 hypothetical protein AAC03nite_35390 [Alicyclobacillus acidoterrestris]